MSLHVYIGYIYLDGSRNLNLSVISLFSFLSSAILLGMGVLLVELANPLAEVAKSSLKDSLAFNRASVSGDIIVAVASILDDIDGMVFGALQGATRTAFPRYCSRSPGVKLSVNPDKALGVDLAPTTSVLVDAMVSTAGLEAILETVLVREVSVADAVNVVLPAPKARLEASVVESAPGLPPLEAVIEKLDQLHRKRNGISLRLVAEEPGPWVNHGSVNVTSPVDTSPVNTAASLNTRKNLVGSVAVNSSKAIKSKLKANTIGARGRDKLRRALVL